MDTSKRDLLIHYDEVAGRIMVHSIDAGEAEGLRARSFDGVCPEVSYFKSMPPEEAEMKMGGLVFALMDLHAERKVGIRAYQAEAGRAHEQLIEELEAAVGSNDPDVQYQLFLHLHSRAMKELSAADLDRAEALLQAAAAQGHEGARGSVISWPMLKAAAERRIRRGPAA